MSRARLGRLGALVLLCGCGHGDAPALPTRAAARAYHYQDSAGLLVGTYGAEAAQRLPGALTVEGKALADYVHIQRGTPLDLTQATADRRAPDAVTSASATAAGGSVSRKWRWEGQAGVGVARTLGTVPVTAGVVARGSSETDYQSVSAAVHGAAELAERNTRLSASLAAGRDRVRPVEVFHGEEPNWPARHHRWAATADVAQLLSPTLVLTAGAAATWQRGRLSSPYRRALVSPTLLLPEALPQVRNRYSGFVGLSWSMTPALALHLQQGVYRDSWKIAAFIPEARLAAEVDDGVLLTGGYRYYAQGAASFYQAVYPEARPVMSGDLRHGPVRDHTLFFEVRRRTRPGGNWELPLLAGYQLSLLDYLRVGSHVVAHVFLLGVEAGD